MAAKYLNFNTAIGLLIVLFPAYLIRFNVARLPTTLLELAFGLIFLVWLVKYARADWPGINNLVRQNRLFFIFYALFFIASLISIFVSDMWWYSLGQWRAYFLEPMLLFIMLLGRAENGGLKSKNLVWCLALSTVSISVYAIIQKFTGWGIATPEWTAPATRRVTAFFSSPNAVGLAIAPIALLLTAKIMAGKTRRQYVYAILFVLIVIALLFTKSVGALAGLAAGLLLFVFLAGYKKTAMAVVVAAILLVLLPPIQNHLLASKYQSELNRLTLWGYSSAYLSRSPKNFILGAGLRQFFRKIQKPHYDPNKMERLIYPHNILLNFWTETGLAGMISFAAVFVTLFLAALDAKKRDRLLGAGLTGALVVIFVHGLIDVPYFKNDLAMIFWTLAALILTSAHRDTFGHQSSAPTK